MVAFGSILSFIIVASQEMSFWEKNLRMKEVFILGF